MIWLGLLLVQNLTDPSLVSSGEIIFAQSCSVGYCHGIAGSAGRGPRLRGRKLDRDYVERVTLEGFPDSGMPGWKDRLSREGVAAVVAYVMSLSSLTEPPSMVLPMPPGTGPAAFPEFTGSPHTKKGRALFFDATRFTHCATCHSVGDRGIPIGPDLTNLSQMDSDQFVSSVRSRRSQHVLRATLENGETFPALRSEYKDKWLTMYDLTSPLPVLRSFDPSQVISLIETTDWAHETVAHQYDDEELRAILPYLQALGSRERK